MSHFTKIVRTTDVGIGTLAITNTFYTHAYMREFKLLVGNGAQEKIK